MMASIDYMPVLYPQSILIVQSDCKHQVLVGIHYTFSCKANEFV